MYQRKAHQQSDEKCAGRNEETFRAIALMKELNIRGKTEKNIQIIFLTFGFCECLTASGK